MAEDDRGSGSYEEKANGPDEAEVTLWPTLIETVFSAGPFIYRPLKELLEENPEYLKNLLAESRCFDTLAALRASSVTQYEVRCLGADDALHEGEG